LARFAKLVDGWRAMAGLDQDTPASPPEIAETDGADQAAPEPPQAPASGLFAGTIPSDGQCPSSGAGRDAAPDDSPADAAPQADHELELSLAEFVQRIINESGMRDFYANDKSDPDRERLANLGELVSSAQQFEEQLYDPPEDDEGDTSEMPAIPDDGVLADENPSGDLTLGQKLLAFLERISLVADIDALDKDQGAVTLMTLHAAKGLEFPVVAMLGVEDGLLPHDRANRDPTELEEERRLAFVGITRAERHLYLTHAQWRTVFGETKATIASRFLDELPDEAVQKEDVAGDAERAFLAGGSAGSGGGLGDGAFPRRSGGSKKPPPFPPGTRVRHPQFGTGTVLTLSGAGPSARAKIEFPGVGRKTLVLEYARLTPA
jgi:DNA helicase-2/ATP-dependent DNA helicase PcrA